MASPALSKIESELFVVGVYRPLELSGRRIHLHRTVYLRAGEFEKQPSIAVGTVMGIYRSQPAGLQSSKPSDTERHALEDPFLKLRVSDSQDTDRPEATLQQSPLQRVLRSQLAPAARLSNTTNGRPAGFGQTSSDSSNDPTLASGKNGENLAHPVMYESRRVGTIQIESVYDGTFVAKVMSDGLALRKTLTVQPHEKSMVAIMAGDIARIEAGPRRVVKAKRPVLPGNVKELKRERDHLVRALRRKSRKPKPFRRKVMKWDL
jgi:hypothetical protein